MLERSGDLIPVKPEAVYIPWTRRKAQVLSLLHRGKVDFLVREIDKKNTCHHGLRVKQPRGLFPRVFILSQTTCFYHVSCLMQLCQMCSFYQNHVFNFHVPFCFQTHVYDTNVGDISPLYVYFNPCRWTVEDLNEKFALGQR